MGGLKFERAGDEIRWIRTEDTSLPPLLRHESASWVIDPIEGVHAFLQSVEATGVTPENGLMALFNYTPAAQTLALRLLADSQNIQHSDVKNAWHYVGVGITTFSWVADDIEDLRPTLQEDWQVGGAWELFFTAHDDVVEVSLTGLGECRCPRREFTQALDILLQRFYEAI